MAFAAFPPPPSLCCYGFQIGVGNKEWFDLRQENMRHFPVFCYSHVWSCHASRRHRTNVTVDLSSGPVWSHSQLLSGDSTSSFWMLALTQAASCCKDKPSWLQYPGANSYFWVTNLRVIGYGIIIAIVTIIIISFFWGKVSLCCSGTSSVDLAGSSLRNLSLSVSRLLDLKVYAITTWLVMF